MSRKFRVREDQYSVILSIIMGIEAGDVAEYVKDEVGVDNSPGYLLRGPKTWRSTKHGDNVLWLHKDLVTEIKEDDAKPSSLQDEYNECVEAVLIRHDGKKVKRLFDIAESGDQTLTHVTVNDDLWLRIPQPMRVALISSMAYVTLKEIV